ncbi:PRA1 family protein-domain-containing protein [Annulohypoxylon truncatum]|uniref:PRA1 family protein-domain-containing protein n=1 Tax=Annulohypoxylon truncatum TaxID=327061 RepID=UPI0020087D45|nr:PRA1 family protein-domain-containing protein [Annulohypoxylon truncatum]KAI1208937.1 PRA1 family protein-domain-containing protein [Annulohypoxylon truncatum]
MARIQIPLDVLTSRLNIQDRFAGFRNTSLSSRFANMRPVGEFLDFKRLSKPANFAEVQSRVNYNLGTFSSNYALVFVLLSVYALITNPLLLFDIVLLVGGMWLLGRLNGQDLTIGTFQATTSQLYTGLLCGLGGRPRAPKFAPQWGRPSRRPRRGYGEEEDDDIWGTGRRVVEELLDSEGTDTQGAENGGRRFASDPLRFTGIDLGGGGQARNGYAYQHSDEEDDDDDGNSTEDGTQATSEEEEDTDDENQVVRRELEEALVQSALSRIRKAQSKGRQDVKLNKEELAALDRRRKRLQAEAEAAKRGGNRKQRKEKEQRYAVPLSQLDPSRGPSGSNESLARKALPSTEQGPPMGRFHPPNASRSRPRSGTSSTSSTQRPRSRIRDSPPFDYQYVNAPPNQRHISDPSGRPSSSASAQNPFQYQTAGPRATYADGAAAVRSSPRRHRSRARRDEEQEDETTSDDAGNREIVVATPSPESERHKAKKSSPGQPTAKKKATSGAGKRRKGK